VVVEVRVGGGGGLGLGGWFGEWAWEGSSLFWKDG